MVSEGEDVLCVMTVDDSRFYLAYRYVLIERTFCLGLGGNVSAFLLATAVGQCFH